MLEIHRFTQLQKNAMRRQMAKPFKYYSGGQIIKLKQINLWIYVVLCTSELSLMKKTLSKPESQLNVVSVITCKTKLKEIFVFSSFGLAVHVSTYTV
jgi:hypothetical protein